MCPHKKRTKESGWGMRCPQSLSLLRGLTVIYLSTLSRPPPDPHPAFVDEAILIDFLRCLAALVSAAVVWPGSIRLLSNCRPAPEGVHRGGRLEAGEIGVEYRSSPDRLRGQRLPYAIFFGYFLAWRQESNTVMYSHTKPAQFRFGSVQALYVIWRQIPEFRRYFRFSRWRTPQP